jgi:gluconate 2-dehydrogenase
MTLPRILVARPVFPDILERLNAYFDVHHNQDDAQWSSAEFAAAAQGVHGILTTGSERIDQALLDGCPDLRICANMAVGFNNFDVPAMTARRVQGTNAPDVLTDTTADFGFALMMAAARRITESEHFLRRGEWKRWRYDMFAGSDIHGSTLGVIGMGRIGQGIAKRGAHGFGMKVIYNNRSPLSAQIEADCKATYVTREELLRTADHVVLVVPYSAESHHTIGAAQLALMKPTATLTNIARGGIVDDVALAAALQQGRIAAAGLDVFEGEPEVHPDLLACSNVVLTPHIASASLPTRRAMAGLAADNLIAVLTGQAPLTPVNQLADRPAAA